MNTTWKRKLASRKLWAAVIAFATALATALGMPEIGIERLIAVIAACGSLIAYIIGESVVDAVRSEKTDDHPQA